MGLPAAELPAAAVIGAVQGGGGVDDEQREAGLAHHRAGLVQQLQLMVAVVRAGICHVIQDLLARQPVPVRHGEQPHWAEGALGVDVQAFPLAAAHVEGELAGDGQGVADLRLAGAELAEDLGDAAGFDAAGQKGVELLRAGGDGDELGTALVHFGGGGESHGDEFRGWCKGARLVNVLRGKWVDGGEGEERVPSARILVAFCSEMPFICSSTLRGLSFALVGFLSLQEILKRAGSMMAPDWGVHTCMPRIRLY